MAEVFGAVASGVGIASFVIQIARNVKKVKQFVDLMNDAPSDLRYLIDGIERLNRILESVDLQTRQVRISGEQKAIISGALDDCRTAALDLSSLSSDLERSIKTHSTKGRIRFAVKNQSLHNFRIRLEAAKTTVLLCQQLCQGILQQDLLLSHLVHLHETRKLQRDILDVKAMVQAPGQAVTLSSQPWGPGRPKRCSTKLRNWQPTSFFGSLFGSIYYSGQGIFGVPMKDRETQEFTIRICTPAWLFRKIRGLGIFEKLFDSKAATPFDRNIEIGKTALHIAAGEGHESVCKFLVDQGADAYALTDNGRNPLYYVQLYAAYCGDDSLTVMNLFRMFIVQYQGDNFIGFGDRNNSRGFLGSGSEPLTRGLALALEQSYPPYYERPVETRVQFATCIRHPLNRPPDAESFRLAITKESIDPHWFHIMISSTSSNLTSRIIYGVAKCIYFNDESTMRGWCSMMMQAVKSEVDLQNVNGSGKTALDIFKKIWTECLKGERMREGRLNAAFKSFIGILEKSGVDLLSYGTKEKEIQEEQLHDYCQSAGIELSELFQGHYFKTKYGSSVDD